jgi:hypothetical protein
MIVVINERQVEYTPAPGKEWTFTSNDPYMYPVRLNNTDCFIKRFEHGDPARVTGWGLLNKLKGKNVDQLPRVFDIKEGEAEGRKALYVFMKLIDGGRTLDQISSLGNEDFIRNLSNDLFSGLASVHSRGYWIADFCEKNVLWDKNGKSYLLDLDSSIPLTDYPRIDMYGSKRYWTPVVKSYRSLMGSQEVVWMELDGSCLNYLQLLLMILHFKLRLPAGSKERTAASLDHLSDYLHTHFPESAKIFSEAFRQGNAFSEMQIGKIKELVTRIIEKDFTTIAPPEVAAVTRPGPGSKFEKEIRPNRNNNVRPEPVKAAEQGSGTRQQAGVEQEGEALEKLQKWAGLHLIFGWIIYGILAVSILFTLSFGHHDLRDAPMSGFLLLLLAFIVIAMLPLRYISRFRRDIREALRDRSPVKFGNVMEHMNGYFRFITIYRMVLIGLMTLLLGYFMADQ